MTDTLPNIPTVPVDWIAVDWGTTNLRAFAMAGDRPVAATTHAKGMGGLAPAEFEAVLLDAVGPWLTDGQTTEIVACGMVGARQGWVEAGYRAVPCAPLGQSGMTPAPAADPRLDMRIVHGLMQTSPPDVMRGEETQIAGLIAERGDFSGVACLPGTHAKWAAIEDGGVKRFSTFMTGELFSLLAAQSVLRHTVGADGSNDAAFDAAAGEALAQPETVPAALFGLRAGALVGDLDPASARARLSGLLIGAEIAAARPFWTGRDVVLIGAGDTCRLYARALAAAGAKAELLDVTRMTLAGLTAARRLLKAGTP